MGLSRLFGFLKTKFPQSISEVTLKDLRGKTIAIDASNIIYKFLLSQMMNRSPFNKSPTDSSGNRAAHIITLITRAISCKKNRIQAVWVFDGTVPIEKFKEDVNRSSYRKVVFQKIDTELSKGNFQKALQYQKRNKKISQIQKQNAIQLLQLMGFPVVQAPAEALAQCAHLCSNGIVEAVVSEDLNSLPLGSKVMLKSFKQKKIEEIHLEAFLQASNLSHDQFIDLCILCGCSYSSIISGIGPSKAFTLIEKHNNIENVLRQLKIPNSKHKIESQEFDYQRARQLFRHPEVTPIRHPLQFRHSDTGQLVQFLNSLGFSQKRISGWLKIVQKYK